MITDSEFYSYDLPTKRKYLLDVFTWIKDTFPIYVSIYSYLHDTEFPDVTILDDLYKKINEIGIGVHEADALDHYHSIVNKIEKLKKIEEQDIESNPDDLLTNLL